MNGGLNDRTTASERDRRCCGLREMEEGKEVSGRELTFKLGSDPAWKTNPGFPFYGAFRGEHPATAADVPK
jgi:hypothetical protein